MKFWPRIAEMIGLTRGTAVPTQDPGTGSGSLYSLKSGGLYQWTGNAWDAVTGESGSATPADPVNSLQFNDAGSFGGFGSWDGTTLQVAGEVALGNAAETIPGLGSHPDNYLNHTRTTLPDNNRAGWLVQYDLDLAADVDTMAGQGASGAISRLRLLGENNYSHTDGTYYRGLLAEVIMETTGDVDTTSPGGIGGTAALQTYAANWASPHVSALYGALLFTEIDTGTIDISYGASAQLGVYGGTVTTSYGFAVLASDVDGGTIADSFAFYAKAQGGSATNAYSFWSDEQGVFRIRADNTFNAVYQAIPALYNPQFTKYTPGVANYERIVFQWESNVAVLTTEKGGTGTLRDLRIGDASVNVVIGGNAVQATGGYKSSDGSAGATGSANNTNTLTIKNGLVTAIA